MTPKWRVVLVALLGVALCVYFIPMIFADNVEKEEKVTIDQLPDAVRTTLENEAKGGTIGEIEKETENGKVVYEAEVTKDGKKYEVEIAEDGKLIEVEEDD